MIVSTFNLRALGGVLKRRKIKELIRSEKIDFLALQETKWKKLRNRFALVCGVLMIAIGPINPQPEEVVEFSLYGVSLTILSFSLLRGKAL
jgi:intracellular septation protein A